MNPNDPRHGRPGRAGYDQHRRDGEASCQPCRDAAARYERGRQHDLLNGRARVVPATGSRRKVQALVALGHPFARIAQVAGIRSENLRKFAYGTRETMTVRWATQINTAYDALSMAIPDTSDGYARRRSSEARRIGARHSWSVPLAWEGLDINDPSTRPYPTTLTGPSHNDVDPVVVERILDGDPTPARHATNAERRQVVAAWTDHTGRSLADLARATGWKPERYKTPSACPTTLTSKEHTAA